MFHFCSQTMCETVKICSDIFVDYNVSIVVFSCCLLPAYMHKEYCFFPTRNKYLFQCNFYSLKWTIVIYNIKENNHQLCFCHNHATIICLSAVTQCWTTQAFSPLFTYYHLTRVHNLTVSLPSQLMGQSSRWLFLCPDEMEKPWLASEKSLAINLSSERVSWSLELWQNDALAL